MRSRLPLLLASVLAFVASGCGPNPTANPFDVGPNAGAAGTTGNGATVAIRRYSDFAGSTPSTTLERVVIAPGGLMKVELLLWNGKSQADLTTPEEIETFRTLQAMYSAGFGNWILRDRDFHVTDQQLFAANYTWQGFGVSASIAGRNCIIGQVTPNVLDRPSYEVWIDLETMQPLKYVERLPTGVVAAEMETESIDFDADISNEQFPTNQVGPQIPVTDTTVTSVAGFPTWLPTSANGYLPAGFVLSSFSVTTLAGRSTVRWNATDGVQNLLIAEYQELQREDMKGDHDANSPPKIGIVSYGAFTSSMFVLGETTNQLGTQIHVLGKVDLGEIELLIEGLEAL